MTTRAESGSSGREAGIIERGAEAMLMIDTSHVIEVLSAQDDAEAEIACRFCCGPLDAPCEEADAS